MSYKIKSHSRDNGRVYVYVCVCCVHVVYVVSVWAGVCANASTSPLKISKYSPNNKNVLAAYN